MSIEIRNVTKQFGQHVVLRDVSLNVREGSLTALLEPSGSGKTTLLRIVAGLEWPDAGSVYFHGGDASERHARDRQVGYVFQHYALFRNMTVSSSPTIRRKHWRSRTPSSCCTMGASSNMTLQRTSTSTRQRPSSSAFSET